MSSIPGARRALAVAALAATVGAGAVASAQAGSRPEPLRRVRGTDPVAVNRSFVSPLVERFGDVRVGRSVFVAGNTILRADRYRRVCLGNETNAQDNILILALADRRAVRGPRACARHSTAIGERTSVAHQASIINSRVGDFTFIGFRARISNSVIEDGAFVLHGTTIGAEIEDRVTFHALSGVTIGDGLDTDDNVVLHGPLVVGDDLTIADEAILFRAVLGDGVTMGDSSIVAGPADDPIDIRDGVTVPEGAVITTQAQADALR